MKKINRVALYVHRMNDEALEVKIQSVIKSMTDNPNFPAPIPELDALQTAFAAFQVALVAQRTGAKEETAIKNGKRTALEFAYRNLGNVVDAKSNNDLSILLSSGFDERKTGTPKPKGRLAKPTDFNLIMTEKPGSIKLMISKIEGASSYMFQYALAPVTDDAQRKTLMSLHPIMTIDNLEPGKQYNFRVGGIGPDPVIIFSDTLTRFVA
jgi:hypothetical protein